MVRDTFGVLAPVDSEVYTRQCVMSGRELVVRVTRESASGHRSSWVVC